MSTPIDTLAGDAVEAEIQAGALRWVPDDGPITICTHSNATGGSPIAPFDGCHFCLAPSKAKRDAITDLGDELRAALDWLDAVRNAGHTWHSQSKRIAQLEAEGVAAVEQAARALARAVR